MLPAKQMATLFAAGLAHQMIFPSRSNFLTLAGTRQSCRLDALTNAQVNAIFWF